MRASLAASLLGEVRASADLADGVGDDVRARTLTAWDQVALWASLGVALFALAPGALLAPANSIGSAAAMVAGGAVVGGALVALAARAGARDRRTLAAVLLDVFGSRAGMALTALLLLRHVLFAALLLSLMAAAAAGLVGGARWPWVAAFAGLGLGLALVGPHLVLPWLVKRLAAPAGVAIVIVIGLSSYLEMGVPEIMRRQAAGGWPGALQGIDLVALAALAWLPLAADFSRFSAPGAAASAAPLAGFVPAALLVGIVGLLYVPLVHAGESWELLTAVPLAGAALVMLLAIETDGVAVLLFAAGSAGRAAGQRRRAVTLASALAAGGVAAAFATLELGLLAALLGLAFLPPVLLWAVAPNAGRGLAPARRAAVWGFAWAAGVLAGLWSVATLRLTWGGAGEWFGPLARLAPESPPALGLLLPATVTTLAFCALASVVLARGAKR